MRHLPVSKASYEYLQNRKEMLTNRKLRIIEHMRDDPESKYWKNEYNKCLCEIETLKFHIKTFMEDCKKYIEDQTNADDKS